MQIKAATQGKSVLTPEQRDKLDLLARVPGSRPAESIRQQVQELLDARLKDSKVVEIETSQAIVARLMEWAKFLGLFVGIPLALLALVLGALGFRTYSDFTNLVKTTQEDVTKRLEYASQHASKIEKEGTELVAQYEALRRQLADVGALSREVKELADKVGKIEEKIAFQPSRTVDWIVDLLFDNIQRICVAGT